MIIEFRIEISTDPGGIRFTLRSPASPLAGQPFVSPLIAIAPADVQALRSGIADDNLVRNATSNVSQWLLNPEIRNALNSTLNTANGNTVRIVVSLNDEELLEKLSDVPFELCTPQGAGAIALVLDAAIESFVHLLPKVGMRALNPESGKYPLRILIVRSNPESLGRGVPKAAAVKDEILKSVKKRADLSAGDVKFDILSAEENSDAPPTFESLIQRLNDKNNFYHLMIYLGHGNIEQPNPQFPAVGVLQFEKEDGENFDSISSATLKDLIQNNPIPVVLLLGCLTAAAGLPDELKIAINNAVPSWMRGSQAVAQTLINSSSGVQSAVGMRYKLENTDALRFVSGFFESLLVQSKGNVESAVRAARLTLRLKNNAGYSWSSPMLFSSLPAEPMFSFLASSPDSACPNTEQQQNLRNIIWGNLAKLAWTQRTQIQGVEKGVVELLKTADDAYIKKVLDAASSLILPGFVEAKHGETVKIPVSLRGELNLDELRGELIVGGESVRVKSVSAAPNLTAGGFRLLSAPETNTAQFTLERVSNGATLKDTDLFDIEVETGTAFSIFYPITINIKKTDPKTSVCGGSNALTIPPP